MSDDAVLAEGIVQACGGVDNVLAVSTCFTRLRLEVRTIDEVDFAQLTAVPGVRLAFEQVGEVHMVVGMRLTPVVRAVRAVLEG